jgi:hypothetical protein
MLVLSWKYLLIVFCYMWIHQNVLIVQAIIVVLKHHSSSLERLNFLPSHYFFDLFGCVPIRIKLACLDNFRHFDTLFEQMCSSNGCICIKLSVVSKLGYSIKVLLELFLQLPCNQIRILRTHIYRMAHLLAALASNVFELHALILLLILVILIIFIVFLALMLRVFATWMISFCLTTTPPLCTSIIVSVSTATPVEVLLLMKLFSTVTTHFNALIHLAFSIFEFDDSLSHLVSFIYHCLNLFLSIHIIIDVLVKLLSL